MGRKTSKGRFPFRAGLGIILCIAMFLSGLATLTHNLKPELDKAESAINDKRALVLNDNLSVEELADFLVSKRIVSDREEAKYVALHIVNERPPKGYECIEELRASKHRISPDTIAAYGPRTLRVRAEKALEEAGADAQFRGAADTTGSRVSFGGNVEKAPIEVWITANDDYPVARSGVLVRLTQWALSSRNEAESEVLGFARTDSEGHAVFNVPVGGSYSVLPIQPGATYGAERGTSAKGMLDAKGLTGKDALKFKARENKIALLSKTAIEYAKKHGLLLVRTPDDFRTGCRKIAVVYVLGWLGVALVLYTRRRPYDYIILVPLMALTGLSFLVLAGMQNPLTDTPYALKTVFHFIVGLGAFAGISLWNYYAALVRPAGKTGRTLMDIVGPACLVLCILLVAWVSVKGFGPGGSDARVNLSAPGVGTFQPSEICKFLFVGFMAYFLTGVRNRLPRAAGKQGEAIKLRLRYTAVMLLVIALTLGVYVVRLKDMGPAMVLLITFIILYSMVRGDTKEMIGWSLAFGALALVARYAGGTREEYLFALAVWVALWLFAGPRMSKRHDLSESALMMVLVILAYTIGGTLLEPISPALAERLSGRVEMCWDGVWDNNVANGDQIVRGLWALASGGHAGMGLGNTLPDMIPAGHTDMILAATGEMTGLTGILVVCVSVLALVYAGFVVASRILGFGRYLTLGITVVTLVQFLLVGLGSLGLIPLSGVAVPLMSQGGVSLIVTLAAFGFVMSTSGFEKEFAMDVKATNKETRSSMLAIRLSGLMGVILLFGAAAYETVVVSGRDIVRPAYSANSKGRRLIVWNPRIQKVISQLQAGNIYDRNGLLLATGSPEDLDKHRRRLLKEGHLTEDNLEDAALIPDDRIYPFGAYTLFMLGNANVENLAYYNAAEPRGYMAESRHEDKLRGLNFKRKPLELRSPKYKAGRFLPSTTLVSKDVLFDYDTVALISMIKTGLKDNPLIREYNSRRDEHSIRLTLDASLQKDLSDALGEGLEKAILKNKERTKYMRVSAVVLDAQKGDLLASANWPLPIADSVAQYDLSLSAPAEKRRNNPALTERDLGTTFFTQPGSTAKVMSGLAGLMGDNPEAAFRKIYLIAPDDRIDEGIEPAGPVDMFKAISLSSNNYFINSLNDQHLYEELDSIYGVVGIRLDMENADKKFGNQTSYIFEPEEFTGREAFDSKIAYIEEHAARDLATLERTRGKEARLKVLKSLNLGQAWGQGYVRATPLTMARVASIVANGGALPKTRYLLTDAPESQQIVSGHGARLMDEAMHAESTKNRAENASLQIGGKTGTPERGAIGARGWLRKNKKKMEMNDAWYICYITAEKKGHEEKLAIAVRIERSIENSAAAKQLMYETILPVLKRHGYTIKKYKE